MATYMMTRVNRQDEDAEEKTGNYNTSDEEFERQLEEAALIEEQEKAEKLAAKKSLQGPKLKKGRGRNAKKKKKLVAKEGGDGYEVSARRDGEVVHGVLHEDGVRIMCALCGVIIT